MLCSAAALGQQRVDTSGRNPAEMTQTQRCSLSSTASALMHVHIQRKALSPAGSEPPGSFVVEKMRSLSMRGCSKSSLCID